MRKKQGCLSNQLYATFPTASIRLNRTFHLSVRLSAPESLSNADTNKMQRKTL